MKKSKYMELAGEALCLVMALVWALAHFRNNHPLFQEIGVDNAIFLSIGKGITQGRVPYVELTENKGPLFFLLMALPQLFIEGTAGVYMLEVGLMLGNCILLVLIMRWLMGGKYHFLASALVIALYLYTPCKSENFCEEYDLFFLLLSIAAVVHLNTSQKHGAWRAYALGISFACIALIKISDLPGAGIALIFYFWMLHHTGNKIYKELFKCAAGIMLVTLPVFIYLLRVNAVGAMFQEYILDNFAHVSAAENEPLLASRLELVKGNYGLVSIIPVVLMMVAVCVNWISGLRNHEKKEQRKWMNLFGLALAATNFSVGYIADSGFMQHLLMGGATLYLAFGMLAGAFPALPKHTASKVAGAVLAGVLCVGISVQSLTLLSEERVEADLAKIEEFVAFQQEFLPELEDCESVCTLGVGIMPDWYWINGLQPAFRYYNISGFIMYHVGEDVAQEFEDFLLEEPCEYLVMDNEIELFRGQLTDTTIDFIHENYELISEGSQGRLLMRYI